MANFTARAITSTRHEWIIPAPPPWGAAGPDLVAAWNAAERAYREAHKVAADNAIPDNALSFKPGDDEIILSFTTEEPTR